MASKLEFERKFLLLKKPVLKADSIARIEQHYFGDERIRRKSEEGKSDVFYHTVKKNLRPGVNSEDEKIINRDDYYSLLEKSKYFIVKYRHYYFIGDLKWEVDAFEDINLVVAEVEYPREDYKLKIPKFIEDVTIMEVTKFREFSNKNIAKKKITY
jgi:CYTH domain-containing protein